MDRWLERETIRDRLSQTHEQLSRFFFALPAPEPNSAICESQSRPRSARQ